LVWYYAEFFQQGESNDVFQAAQKIYGIQRKPKTSRDIRQEVSGFDKNRDSRENDMAKAFVDKPFPPGAESERKFKIKKITTLKQL
jgi:hypothetical protein